MTFATLVTGGLPSEREAAIAAAIRPEQSVAIVLEGLPDGNSPLDALQRDAGESRSGSSPSSSSVRIVRIIPGCPCCSGNLTMRVTLNRLLRHPPDHLYISLAPSSHIDKVHTFLSAEPYGSLLSLTKSLRLEQQI